MSWCCGSPAVGERLAGEPGTEREPVRCADWLEFARSLAPGSVDLVYADPPFNTGHTQRGRAGAYADRWATTADWASWLEDRVRAIVPALRETGSILLHVDWRTSHHARLVLDRVLGEDAFVNHIVWSYGLGGSSPTRFARKHDDILFYARTPGKHYFDAPRVPATGRRLAGETKKATDVLDIPAINNMARERVGYPTQKPLALLELLVGACCPSGGLVVDPCCGSGTTLVAARTLGRRALGADVNPDAVAIAHARLDHAARG